MSSFIFVDSSGNPKHCVTTFTSDSYVAYKTYDELLCVEYNGEVPSDILLSSWYYDNSQDTFLFRGVQPDIHMRWNFETLHWEDSRTLQEHRDIRWVQIKRSRTQAEFDTFTYNDMIFDGDVNAQRRLGSYISVSKSAIAAKQPFQASFTLANNTEVTLTAQDFVAIEMAKVQQVATAFAHAIQLRARIDAATTPEEVESVVW